MVVLTLIVEANGVLMAIVVVVGDKQHSSSTVQGAMSIPDHP